MVALVFGVHSFMISSAWKCTYLYTGDIKLQRGVIFIACETWNIRMQKTWQPALVLQIMQLRSRGI